MKLLVLIILEAALIGYGLLFILAIIFCIINRICERRAKR